MKSLITGIDGFIGTWLTKELQRRGDEVSGMSRSSSQQTGGVQIFVADLTDANGVSKIIQQVQPDRIFHLAAQSNIPQSFIDPAGTMAVNVGGTLHLLEAIKAQSPNSIFISVGSSAEYGRTAHQPSALTEDMPLAPSSPYGISKAAQGYYSHLYWQAFQIKSIHVRPFAIIGPGKTKDALYDFCQGILRIEAGTATQLLTGNLDTIRDFVDVRDMVNTLIALSEQGQPGETYNICSGRGTSLQQILKTVVGLSKAKVDQAVDEKRSRPADDPIIVGSIKKLAALHIQNQWSLEQTIADTLEYWRSAQK